MTAIEGSKVRRRGAVLEREIYEAAFCELMQRGCSQFSIEGVAHASGSSKASIYRRWSDREDLILDTVDFYFPQIVKPTPHGEPFLLLREALQEVIGFFNSDLGQIAYNLLIESRKTKRFSEIFDKKIAEPRREFFRRVLIENYKGGVLIETDLIRVANVASSLLIHNVFLNAPPIDMDFAREIVDEVAIPLADGITLKRRDRDDT